MDSESTALTAEQLQEQEDERAYQQRRKESKDEFIKYMSVLFGFLAGAYFTREDYFASTIFFILILALNMIIKHKKSDKPVNPQSKAKGVQRGKHGK